MPPVVQLLKNFQRIFGTVRFITMFRSALHWSLFWARSTQSIPLHSIYPRSIMISSTHLRRCLPSGLLLSEIPICILHVFIFSPFVLHAPSFHSNWPDHYNYTCRRVQVMKLLIIQFSPISCQLLFGSNNLISTVFSNSISLCSP
jgi:hypothetical protein